MGKYIHGSQEEVQADCDIVFVNMLRSKAAEYDGWLYTPPPVTNKIFLPSLDDATALALGLQLLGRTKGVLRKDTGFTIAYAIPTICNDDDAKYYAPVSLEFTEGVTCAIIDFNEDWKQPTGEA